MMSTLNGHISESTTLNFVVYVDIKSVVPSSQSERNDLFWPVQFVEAV